MQCEEKVAFLVSLVNFFSLYPEYIYFAVICLFTPMPTAMATIEHATQLLDFTQKLDITLLDSVVSCFYMAQGPQVETYFPFIILQLLNVQILEK